MSIHSCVLKIELETGFFIVMVIQNSVTLLQYDISSLLNPCNFDIGNNVGFKKKSFTRNRNIQSISLSIKLA